MKNERIAKFKIGTWVLLDFLDDKLPLKIIDIKADWYVTKSIKGEEFDFHQDYEDEMTHITKKKDPEYFV